MNLSTLPLAESQRLQALDATFRSLPARGHLSVMATVAAQLGYSLDGLNKIYRKWKRGGIGGMLDKRLSPAPRADQKATPEVTQRYVTLCEKSHRKDAPAYRVLRAELLSAGLTEREIPSHSALRNAAQKVWLDKKMELAVARHGLVAASAFKPQVLSTRQGLWVGSHLVIDDMWHDHFVRICRGEKSYSVVRPMELGILDLFSGCRFAWGCRPRLPKDDGTFDQLKEAETRFLLAGQLALHGYSPRGTTYLAEHGTAAIRERVVALLSDRTNGIVKVTTSGIIGNESVMAGMFAGQGKGNFKFKAALESLHNLIHNEAGFISAQAGRNKDSRPETTNTMLRYTSEVTEMALALEQTGMAELLALPVLDWHSQWMPMLGKLHQRINSRTDHMLEGWAKCGHVVTEYLVPADMAQSLGMGEQEQWIGPCDYLALPGHVRSAVRLMAQGDPYTNTRQAKLSPQHVFNAGSGALVKMPDCHIAEILTLHGDLDPKHFRERKIESGYLRTWDVQKDSAELRYESVLTDVEGRQRELPAGSEWLVCTNPFDLERAWLFNAKGAFQGTLPRARRVSRLDEAAVLAEMGHASHRASVLLDGYKDRHAAEAAELTAMREHNTKLLGQSRPAPRRPARLPASSSTARAELAALLAAAAEPADEFLS